MNIISSKTLGRLETDLSGRVLNGWGEFILGLNAAGYGGGGVHGYRSFEGTFLGGWLFSGREPGRAMADIKVSF